MISGLSVATAAATQKADSFGEEASAAEFRADGDSAGVSASAILDLSFHTPGNTPDGGNSPTGSGGSTTPTRYHHERDRKQRPFNVVTNGRDRAESPAAADSVHDQHQHTARRSPILDSSAGGTDGFLAGIAEGADLGGDEATNHGNPFAHEASRVEADRIREKLWGCLFGNLERAVDDLYHMVEYVSDIERCTVAVSALDQSAHDFRQLLTRLEQMEMAELSHRQALAEQLGHNTAIGSDVGLQSAETRSSTAGTPNDREGISGRGLTRRASGGKGAVKSAIAFPTRKSSPTSQRSKIVQQLQALEQVRASLPENSAWRKPMTHEALRVQRSSNASAPDRLVGATAATAAPAISGRSTKAKTPSPRVRALHEKLSSPERKASKSRSQLQQELDKKQETARLHRARNDEERRRKNKNYHARIKDVSTAQHRSREALRSEIDEALEKAARAREKYIEQIARKAGIESEKVAEVAFIKRMEGSHGKHSLEKRLSDAARRRQQHLETIRAKQQKMTKSPTASKDSKKGNSRADDEQSTSASSTPNNSRPSSKHGLPPRASSRNGSQASKTATTVGGVAELEAQEAQELQQQQHRLLVAITQQYNQGQQIPGVEFAKPVLPARQGSMSGEGVESHEGSSPRSAGTSPAQTAPAGDKHQTVKSRFRASSAPFIPRIVVEGVGLGGGPKAKLPTVGNSTGNRNGATNTIDLPPHALSLQAVSTKAMKKRARTVRVALLSKLSGLSRHELLRLSAMPTEPTSDDSTTPSITAEARMFRHCCASLEAFFFSGGDGAGSNSRAATAATTPASRLGGNHRKSKGGKRTSINSNGANSVGGSSSSRGSSSAHKNAKQRKRMLAHLRDAAVAVESAASQSAGRMAPANAPQQVEDLSPAPPFFADATTLHALLALCRFESFQRDAKVFGRMLELLGLVLQHWRAARRYVLLSGDVFLLFDLLRQFMRDQRVVLSEDSLSTQEAIFVRLLELLICAMDCDMERLGVPPGNTVVAAHAARPGHSSPAGDNTSAATAEDSAGVPTAEPAATFVFVREELVKYCANLGCVSWFSTVFNSFDGSTAAQLHVSVAVLNFLEFISRPAGGYAHFEQPKPGMGSKQERGAQTSLLHTMKVTEFGGIIPLLLTVLLNPEQNKAAPLLQQLDVRTLIVPAVRMLVNLGLQNAELVQEILASRGVQAAFTHLIKFVLGKYLVVSPPPFAYGASGSGGGGGGGTGGVGPPISDGQCRDEDVLNWAIRSIGLFTHGHAANQDAMHWGEPPTILSLLVKSCPFRYFSNPQLQAVLFPTLVAMCDGNAVNTQILSEAVNPKSLAGFIRTHIYGSLGDSRDSKTQHRATLATTCAVLMDHAAWQKAEHYFDTFQDTAGTGGGGRKNASGGQAKGGKRPN